MKYPRFEDVAAFWPLMHAARRASRGKRHTSSAAALMTRVEIEVMQLESEFLRRGYRPQPYRTFTI